VKIKRKEEIERIHTHSYFKDGLGVLMDAIFSIPMVKSGVSPLLDLEAFISLQIQQRSFLRLIIFRTGGSVQLASLNEFRKLV
jgi:hypothetical protein